MAPLFFYLSDGHGSYFTWLLETYQGSIQWFVCNCLGILKKDGRREGGKEGGQRWREGEGERKYFSLGHFHVPNDFILMLQMN